MKSFKKFIIEIMINPYGGRGKDPDLDWADNLAITTKKRGFISKDVDPNIRIPPVSSKKPAGWDYSQDKKMVKKPFDYPTSVDKSFKWVDNNQMTDKQRREYMKIYKKGMYNKSPYDKDYDKNEASARLKNIEIERKKKKIPPEMIKIYLNQTTKL